MVRLATCDSIRSPRTTLRLEELDRRDVPAVLGVDDFGHLTDPAKLGEVSTTAEPIETIVVPGRIGQPLRSMPRDRYAVSTGAGQTTQVNVYDSLTGSLIGIITPFGREYTHGATVAVGDVNDDGVPDIIVGAGAGSSPIVKIFDGKTLTELRSFRAYEDSFLGGVGLAVGDVTGDSHADIITGAGLGGGPRVQVFSGRELFPKTQNRLTVEPSPILNFFAYSDSFNGGVNVAVGDVNGDGIADIVTGAGAGGGPHVMVFHGKTGEVLQSFFAYDENLRYGVNVSIGDLNRSGQATIVTALMTGGGQPVRFFEPGNSTPRELNVFPQESANGISLALRDINGDEVPELIVATGPNTSPKVKVVNPISGDLVREFPGFMPEILTGLYVG